VDLQAKILLKRCLERVLTLEREEEEGGGGKKGNKNKGEFRDLFFLSIYRSSSQRLYMAVEDELFSFEARLS